MWKIVSNQLCLIRNAIGQFVIVTQPIQAKLCINYSDSRDWASWLPHTPYCFQRHRFVHVCWFPDVFLTIMSEINVADSIRTFIFASLAATFKYMAVLFIPLCGSLLAQGYSKRNDLENFTDVFQRGGLFSISRFHIIVILENISSCWSQSPAASEKHKCTAIKPSRDWVLVFFIMVEDKVCISKWKNSQEIHSKAYVSIRWCHRGPPGGMTVRARVSCSRTIRHMMSMTGTKQPTFRSMQQMLWHLSHSRFQLCRNKHSNRSNKSSNCVNTLIAESSKGQIYPSLASAVGTGN